MANTITITPDSTVTIEDMHKYGYNCYFMLPLGAEAAKKLYEDAIVPIYRLYQNGTEAMVEMAEEISDHCAKGGLFGIEKEDWDRVQGSML